MAHWAESLNESIHSFLRKTPYHQIYFLSNPPTKSKCYISPKQQKEPFQKENLHLPGPMDVFMLLFRGEERHHLSRSFSLRKKIEIRQSHSPNPIPSGCCVLWLSWFAHLGAVGAVGVGINRRVFEVDIG